MTNNIASCRRWFRAGVPSSLSLVLMTSEPVSSYAIPYSLDSIAPGIAVAVFGPCPRAGMNPGDCRP